MHLLGTARTLARLGRGLHRVQEKQSTYCVQQPAHGLSQSALTTIYEKSTSSDP